MKQEKAKSILDGILGWGSLALVALIFFGLGVALVNYICMVIAMAAAIMSYSYLENHYGKEAILKEAVWLIPLGVFFLLLSFSGFYSAYYGSMSTFLIYGLVTFLGLTSFFVLGTAVKRIPKIRMDLLLLIILGAMGLYVLILLIYILYAYGPFYTILYRGMIYYFDGSPFSITTETKAIVGGIFSETSIKYGCYTAFLLSCSATPLIFMNPKEDIKTSAILGGFAFLGLLFLIVIPYWRGIRFTILIYILTALYRLWRYLKAKYPEKEKTFRICRKVAFFGLAAIVLIGVFALLLEDSLHLFERTGLANRSFVSNIILSVQDILYNGSANKDLGYSFSSILFGYSSTTSLHFTDSFEFNILWQNGLLAFLLLCYLIFFFIYKLAHYLDEDKEDMPVKILIVSLIVAIFLYLSFYDDEMPLIRDNEFLPMSRGNRMLSLLFLLGFSYPLKGGKEEKVPENVENSEKEWKFDGYKEVTLDE